MGGIYCLKEAAVVGSMGGKTFREESFTCKTCKVHRPEFTKFIYIEHKFDIWFGEDIIQEIGSFFVSERLKEALESEAISGIVYDKITVLKSEHFEMQNGAYQDDLPQFFYLSPINYSAEINSPIFEFKGEICPDCKGRKYDLKPDGLDYLVGLKNESGEIKIYKNTWNGEDFFMPINHLNLLLVKNSRIL